MTTVACPTSVTTPTVRSSLGRARWAVADTLTVTKRNLLAYTRIPESLFFSTVQPIMFVLLFTYVFGGAIHVPAATYVNYLMPGVFVQTVAFGAVTTSIGLAEDLQKGIIERFRALPMARSAVLTGRTTADLVRNVVTVVIITVVGLLVGFRPTTGVVAYMAGILVILLFAYALSWGFAIIGLSAPNSETAQVMSFPLLFPLIFASSAFVPVSVHARLAAGIRHLPAGERDRRLPAVPSCSAARPAKWVIQSVAWAVGPAHRAHARSPSAATAPGSDSARGLVRPRAGPARPVPGTAPVRRPAADEQNGTMAPDSPTARPPPLPTPSAPAAELAVGDRTFEIFRLAALADHFDVARLALFDQGPAREPAAPRGRHHRHAGRHRGHRPVGANDPSATASGEPTTPRSPSPPSGCSCRTSPACRASSTWPPCATRSRELGGDPSRVDPLVPVDLVIDHSVIVEVSGRADAYDRNVDIEYQRNIERYQVLRWAQQAFDRLRVVPPGTGICHQVNLEYLSRVVFATDDGRAYCDTLVGADSHTTMVNGLGVLGWGVGGIEAEAAMLGQPLSMLLPPVVGFRLTGEQPVGTTATDLVLTITHLLRQHGVVGKFVEFYGPGVAAVPLANRATIGNMSPEYGATCAMFPIDEVTLDYLRFTGRDEDHIALVEAYAKEQGLFHRADGTEPVYSESIELDLSTVVPSHRRPVTAPGPRRPRRLPRPFRRALGRPASSAPAHSTAAAAGTRTADVPIEDGHVVVAAITSCTNTSNPEVMVAAGLLASKAAARGLRAKPGSRPPSLPARGWSWTT